MVSRVDPSGCVQLVSREGPEIFKFTPVERNGESRRLVDVR